MRAALLLLALPLLAACSASNALNAISGSEGVIEATDLPYGPLERQRHDLYTPKTLAPDAPLVVFIHGGSWDEGSKDIYRFLGTGLGDAGYQVLVPNYRLAPEVVFPAFVEDAAAAVAHAVQEIAPDRPLVLMGHSAGAQIAGLLAYDERYLAALGLSNCTLDAFVGLSGPYDFLPLRQERYKRVFPEETRAASQPIAFADGPAPVSFLVHGQADIIVHPEDTTLMAEALDAAGNRVETVLYPGVGHIPTVAGFSRFLRSDPPVFADVTAFLEREAAAGWPGCAP